MIEEKEVQTPENVSRRGLARHRENPFWEPSEVKVGKKHIKVAGGVHVGEEGDSVQHSGVHIVHEIDKEEFVKLYTKNMKVFFDLKPSTQKVLQVVLHAVQRTPNTDSIYLHWLSAEEYIEEHGIKISRASFHNSVKELLTKKFIAESVEPHRFWINPHLFFNGNRMTFVNEFRIKNEKEVKPKKPKAISRPDEEQKELSL